jgi:ElaB/YqjD/DUF883 family membrane-anchored ribosome-binding protein
MAETTFSNSDSLSDRADRLTEKAERAFESGRQAFHDVRDIAQRSRGYLNDTTNNLTKFVRRDPLLAMASAFAVGFFAAQIVKRLP